MRETEVDYQQRFDHQGIKDLVNETFDSLDASASNSFRVNGRLNISLLVKNAKILLASGDIILAKNIFRALVEEGEALGVAYSGLGGCYELEGKIDLAIKAYREAIIFEPTYGCLSALADLYVKKEDYQNAAGTLLRALNLPKLNAASLFELHKSLGNCYMHLAQLNNAESHYRKAYELNPAVGSLHVNIGSLAMKKGDLSTALLHFREAIRIEPQNANAFTGSGLAQLGLGQKESAHDSFASALRLDIKNVTALYHLVKCAYELKKFETVSELLQTYISNNAVNSNILYSFAGILFHRGLLSEALEETEKLLALSPDHGGAKRLKEMILDKIAT